MNRFRFNLLHLSKISSTLRLLTIFPTNSIKSFQNFNVLVYYVILYTCETALMNILTLFYMMLYTFINISIHKAALVNPNYFITILLNNYLKKHKK
jgi:hypothetical protein